MLDMTHILIGENEFTLYMTHIITLIRENELTQCNHTSVGATEI
jgi:hypothetical protein